MMLVSLKAGGVGLNLTAASTVILLDPWWCVLVFFAFVSCFRKR